MFKVLGVTGGIGSGKTYICNLLKENFNAIVLDADIIAKDIMKQENTISKIIEKFGDNILNSDKKIDSKKIAKLVFNDNNKLQQLNNIVHPLVMEEISNRINSISTNIDSKLIVLDVPLPIKEFIDICDCIITVISYYETRISRVMQRSNLSKDEVVLRIKNQLDDEEYKKIADFIIYNDTDDKDIIKHLSNIVSTLE